MANNPLKLLVGCLSVTALAGLHLVSVVNVNAQSTTDVNLTITSGGLTMYAGDGNLNYDLCAPGDTADYSFDNPSGSTTAVTCGPTERSFTLAPLQVKSTTQTSTISNIVDVMCEDLSGSTATSYSVSVRFGDFVNQSGGANLNIGTAASGGVSVVYTNQQTAPAVEVVLPASARATENAKFTLAANVATPIEDTSTSRNVFSSTSTTARRFAAKGASVEYTIPPYPAVGTYLGSIVYTCSAT